MKFIDKSLKKDEGEAIVTEFLNCFYKRKGAFPNDVYNAFSSEIDDNHGHAKFRQRLVDEVLLPEQDGLCCYCLRRLEGCRTMTVEHIMPNHANDKAELDKYRIRPTVLDSLPHTNDFKVQIPNTTPPHPHSVAYQNLVVSCDGDLFNEKTKPVCCNLKRKHVFIHPFILYSNINNSLIYTLNGTAEWIDDPEPPESKKNTLRILGLNISVLKMIRRIWFFCNDHNLKPFEDDKDTIVNTMIGYFDLSKDSEREVNMLLNFKNEKYWNLLLQYDAFNHINHQ